MGDYVTFEGPIPVSFSMEPVPAAKFIFANPRYVQNQLHKVTSKLLNLENVSLHAAKVYLAKHRAANGRMTFNNKQQLVNEGSSCSGIQTRGKRTSKKPRLCITPSGSQIDEGRNYTIIKS